MCVQTEKLRFVEITDLDTDNPRYACLPNSDQTVTRIQGHSNISFQYNGSVYPYHIFLNCKTKLQTILISATRKEFEIIFWTKPKIWPFSKPSEFLNLTSRVHLYTQFDNQLDIYNDIVANGINPDSSSWDLRKTFELMKDPREDAKWISFFSDWIPHLFCTHWFSYPID